MVDPHPRGLLQSIPRLQRLAVFDAAARLGSFTAAATELGMTQPAVTRHIKELERDLGVTLFIRSANRSELSESGWVFRHAVEESFAVLERSIAELVATPTEFVLATHPGLAQHWLVQRIDRLQATLGDVDLRLWIFDREAELVPSGFDAAIRVGDGSWNGLSSKLLFPEVVTPVASAEFAALHNLNAQSSAADVFGAPLLHMDHGDRPWMSWVAWLDRFDIKLPRRATRVLYNNYPVVLQEALAGRGIALGWSHLVEELFESGLLVPVGPTVEVEGIGYYLCWPNSRPHGVIPLLTEWLVAEFAETKERSAT